MLPVSRGLFHRKSWNTERLIIGGVDKGWTEFWTRATWLWSLIIIILLRNICVNEQKIYTLFVIDSPSIFCRACKSRCPCWIVVYWSTSSFSQPYYRLMIRSHTLRKASWVIRGWAVGQVVDLKFHPWWEIILVKVMFVLSEVRLISQLSSVYCIFLRYPGASHIVDQVELLNESRI